MAVADRGKLRRRYWNRNDRSTRQTHGDASVWPADTLSGAGGRIPKDWRSRRAAAPPEATPESPSLGPRIHERIYSGACINL